MIEFKRAAPEDVPVLVSTRQKVWDATYRGIYPDSMIDDFDFSWHIAREEKNLKNPCFHTFLVMENGKCLGYVTYIVQDRPLWRDYCARLLSLYLLPRAQGRGLGSKILKLVQRSCRELGCEKLYLSCSPENASAIGFYTHMGGRVVFEDIGHENIEENSIEFEFYCER